MSRLAFVLTLALAVQTPLVYGGDGHDHGDAAPVANANGPQRLPDGSVFLPKPAQRQMGVRTMIGETRQLPRAVELSGKVVMDPNAGGNVQSLVVGRLEAGPRGLPSIGQVVRKGEILAYVVPSASAIERSNQTAQLAELNASHRLARKRLSRLMELADTVPRKDIEVLESEVASLGERITAVSGGLASRDALTAPVSGVIASAHAVAGQVVDTRELIFEVVDPSRLRVEALAFDTRLAANMGSAFLAGDKQRIPLSFVGASHALREQALPLVFRTEGATLANLAIGQLVQVVVQTRTKLSGVSVPAASLMKNPSNQTIVWVKTAPERFEPRTVTTEPLDGVDVIVTSGLKAGDRLATSAANLINQIR